MSHKGPRLFISGIPASGKSYLAKLLAQKVGGICVSLDDLRGTLGNDEKYKKWTNFYWDLDEKKYLTETSPDDQWKNLVSQSEGLWPAFLEEINKYSGESRPVIFECVNILPHLAKRDIGFSGIALLGPSLEDIFDRNKKSPRWGKTEELQRLEAKSFFEIERPRYKAEALKYGYQAFERADDAVDVGVKILTKK